MLPLEFSGRDVAVAVFSSCRIQAVVIRKKVSYLGGKKHCLRATASDYGADKIIIISANGSATLVERSSVGKESARVLAANKELPLCKAKLLLRAVFRLTGR